MNIFRRKVTANWVDKSLCLLEIFLIAFNLLYFPYDLFIPGIENKIYAEESSWSQTTFNGASDGTYTSTEPKNTNADLGLTENSPSLSNDGGGDWSYRKQVTIDNTSNPSELTDYQVELDSEKDMVGHWNFDEASGATAYDSSRNGNNGTLYGAVNVPEDVTPWDAGFENNITGFSSINSNTLTRTTSEAYKGSYSFSIKRNDLTGAGGAAYNCGTSWIVGETYKLSGYYKMSGGSSSARMRIRTNGTNAYSGGTERNVLVENTSTWKYFEVEVTAEAITNNSNFIWIGTSMADTNTIVYMDELRLSVLTDEGKFGKALRFDGVNDYVDMQNPLLEAEDDFSVSAWVYPTMAPTGVGRIVTTTYRYNGGSGKDRGWTLGENYGSGDIIRFTVYSNTGAGRSVGYSGFFAEYLNQWVYVTGVYNPSQEKIELYINNDIYRSAALSGLRMENSTGQLRVGARADTTTQGNWHGLIDEVKIYNRSLSAIEVQQEYQSPKPLFFQNIKPDGSDIRFTDSDGETEIPYWIESFNNNTNGIKNYKIWTKVPNIPTGNKDIYIYYGNASASSSSSTSNTFVREINGGQPLKGSWHLDKGYDKDKNLINPDTWNIGQGSVTGFSQNGSTEENHRFLGADPFGNSTAVWEARPDSVSGPDGGWNGSQINIDPTKTYRFSVWVNRTVQGNGSFYLGTRGYDSSGTNIGVLQRSNGNNNTNPYFWYTGTPTNVNQWRLVVGHIWPVGSGTGSQSANSGIYTTSGKVGNITEDFVWNSGTAKTLHRSYLYYSTDTSTRQRWAYPRIDLVDGTEPSISTLISSRISKLKTYDTSGNNNNGTAYGVNLDNDGKFGKALNFDGVDDNILVPDNGSLTLPSFMTISAWVKPSAFDTSYPTILRKAGSGSGYEENYHLRVSNSANDGRVLFRIGNGTSLSSVVSSGSIPLSEWTHIAATYDGSKMSLYLNGVLNNTTNTSITPYTTNNSLQVGSYQNGNYYFKGMLDELKIYNRALSSQEISDIYGSGGNRSGYTTTNYPGRVLVRNYSSPEPVASVGSETSSSTYSSSGSLVSENIGPYAGFYDWGNLNFNRTLNGQGLTVDILRASDNAVLASDVSSGTDLSSVISNSETSIKLMANFTSDGSNTALLNDWAIAYSTDSTPPIVPSNLNLTPVSSSRIDLSWDAATDSESGLAGYKIERAPDDDGSPGTWSQIDISPTNSYQDSTVSANTKYWYRIRAYDNNGNNSGYSGELNFDTNTKGLWHFNEGTGGTTANASGNANTGTLNIGGGGTQTTTTQAWNNGTSGKFDKSINFDGTDDYIEIENSAQFNIYPLTIQAWIKTTETTLVRPIVNKYVASSFNGYMIWIADGEIKGFYYRNSSNYVGSINGGFVADGLWHHVVYTISSSGGKLYVDGSQKATGGWTGTPGATTTDQNLSIGFYSSTPNGYFSGQIDEVMVSHEELSLPVIQDIFNEGVNNPTGAYSLSDPPTGATASDGTYTDKIAVSWSSGGAQSGYRVYRDGDKDTGTQIYDGALTDIDDTITGSHIYYIYSKNGDGVLSASYSSDNGSTLSEPPSAPSAGTPEPLSTDTIRWNFTDNSTGETGFRLHDSAHSVKATGGPDISYIDEGSLSANSGYTRHVHAYNAVGDSDPSANMMLYTKIESPTGASFNTVESSSIALSATGTISNLTADSSGIYFRNTEAGTNSTWLQSNSWASGSLTPNTAYNFYVMTRNAQALENTEVGPYSQTTLAAVPSLPTVSGDYDMTDSYHSDITVNANLNPAGTEFAVTPDNGVSYLQADGSLNITPYWSNSLSWMHKDLDANTSYGYKVKARNSDLLETSLSGEGADTTPPAAPTGLGASFDETTDTAFSWNASSGANTYTFSYGTDAFATNLGETGSITQLTTTKNSLSTETPYYYKVKAVSSTNGEGAYSTISSFAISSAPTLMLGTPTATDTINWTWNDNSSYEDNYKVYDNVEALKQSLGASVSNWSEGSLNANTSYSRHVHAENANGKSAASNTDSAYTLIQSPTGISFDAIAADSITVSGSGTLSNLTADSSGIYFENTTESANSGWMQANGWNSSSLDPNTQYSFRARTRNSDGVANAPTATVPKYTLAAIPGVSELNAGSTSSINVKLATNSNPAATTYAIYETLTEKYVQADGSLGLVENWQTYAGFGGISGIDITGLTANTTYTFKVKAKNAEVTETESGSASFKATLALEPDVSANKSVSTWYKAASITLTNNQGFGSGSLEYYRYRVNTSPTYDFNDDESLWSASAKSLNLNSTEDYYIHIKAYNAEDVGCGTQSLGPFTIDATSPSISGAPSASSPTTNKTPAFSWSPSADSHSGISGYYIKLGTSLGGAEVVTTKWIGNATNYKTPSLNPGTYYLSVRAKDNVGNLSNYRTGSVVVEGTPAPAVPKQEARPNTPSNDSIYTGSTSTSKSPLLSSKTSAPKASVPTVSLNSTKAVQIRKQTKLITQAGKGNLKLAINKEGKLKLTADIKNLNINIHLDDAKSAKAFFNGKTYTLEDDGHGNYNTNLDVPSKPGSYSVIIEVLKDDRTKEKIELMVVLIDPNGFIFDKKTNNRIVNATVSLFEIKGSKKQLWDAKKFSQTNPQESNDNGEYAFMVPPGKFILKVQAPGYKEYTSKTIAVTQGHPVTMNIGLEGTGLKGLTDNWKYISLALLALVAGLTAALFLIGKKKKIAKRSFFRLKFK